MSSVARKTQSATAPGLSPAAHRFFLDVALGYRSTKPYTQGRLDSDPEYREMLGRTGFVDVDAHDILDEKIGNPTRLIVAKKPLG